MTRHVFISYSRRDTPLADEVYSRIQGAGFLAWIDQRSIRPGLNYAEEIGRAISDAEVVVLLLSTASNDSREIHREIQLASSANVPVIPLRLEVVAYHPALAYYLSGMQWIDATVHVDRALGILLDHLRALAPPPAMPVMASPATERVAPLPAPTAPVPVAPAPVTAAVSVVTPAPITGAGQVAAGMPQPAAEPAGTTPLASAPRFQSWTADRPLPVPQRWWWEHLRDLDDATVEKGAQVTPDSRTGRHQHLWQEVTQWLAAVTAVALADSPESWVNRPNRYQIGKLSYTYWARLAPHVSDGLEDGLHVGLQLSKRIKWVDQLPGVLARYQHEPVMTLWASTNDRLLQRTPSASALVAHYGQLQLALLTANPRLQHSDGALVRRPGSCGLLLEPAIHYLDARQRGVLPDPSVGRVALFSPLITMDQMVADPEGVSRLVADYLRLLSWPVREARRRGGSFPP